MVFIDNVDIGQTLAHRFNGIAQLSAERCGCEVTTFTQMALASAEFQRIRRNGAGGRATGALIAALLERCRAG